MPSKDSKKHSKEHSQEHSNAIPSTRIPDTRWYQSFAAAGLHDPAIHGELGHWLKLEGSLTRALQLRCQHSFRVEILSEGFTRPNREEAHTLGLSPRHNAWVREVCLLGDDTPWVLARTIASGIWADNRWEPICSAIPNGKEACSRPACANVNHQTSRARPGAPGSSAAIKHC